MQQGPILKDRLGPQRACSVWGIKCFDKYRWVPKIVVLGRETYIRQCFENYRCVPRIASPEARKKN